MKWKDGIWMSVRVIKASKVKTILNLLGIIIGVMSIVTILCIGKGGEQSILSEFDRFGMDTISIKPVQGKQNNMGMDEYTFLTDHLLGDLQFTPVYMNQGTIDSGGKNRNIVIFGVSHSFAQVFPVKMVRGRQFSRAEEDNSRRVCTVEQSLARNISGGNIRINTAQGQLDLRVTGIMENSGGSLSQSFAENIPAIIYAPTQMMMDWFGAEGLDYISIKSEDQSRLPAIGDRAISLLARRGGGEYYAEDLTAQKDVLQGVISILTLIIGAIAAISLIVGGLGVMNVMLVSAASRREEIGIMKATGAQRGDILMQFLIEAAMITLFGTLAGMAGGLVLGAALTHLMGIAFVVDIFYLAMVAVFVTISGVLFGVYPAKVAAGLDPMQALR